MSLVPINATGDPFSTTGGDFNPPRAGISDVFQSGIGSLFEVGFSRLADEISPTQSQERLVIERREERRRRRAEREASGLTINGKSLIVAVGVSLAALVALSMMFRK